MEHKWSHRRQREGSKEWSRRPYIHILHRSWSSWNLLRMTSDEYLYADDLNYVLKIMHNYASMVFYLKPVNLEVCSKDFFQRLNIYEVTTTSATGCSFAT
ncbi:hypothetical protein ACS0TY_036152 [Phlomoides rotata]